MSAMRPGEEGASVIKSAPVVANRNGFYFEVTAGRRYLWCARAASTSDRPIGLTVPRDPRVLQAIA